LALAGRGKPEFAITAELILRFGGFIGFSLNANGNLPSVIVAGYAAAVGGGLVKPCPPEGERDVWNPRGEDRV
jgi:hypothetical protein